MKTNPLKQLESLGQSIWLDYIRRDLIRSGELKRLIEEDGLRGMTSNPTLFEQAITQSNDYDEDIQRFVREGKNIHEIYDLLTWHDVQEAADVFHSVFMETNGKDGYVSLEVNPHLANDTNGTIKEARRLWQAVARPNIFIKVPATQEGLPAIRQLISEGINVNVTILFGLQRYRDVAKAYIAGLEDRLKADQPIDKVKSVASFFLSRIDVKVDAILEKLISANTDKADLARKLQGEVAIASAKIAYQDYKEIFGVEHFKDISEKGGSKQRLLWASTGTKNPAYSDIKYIEPLIGPNTVNTVPMETLKAYLDHGKPEERLEKHVADARWTLSKLSEVGIDIDEVTKQLEEEGVSKFNKAFDDLMASLDKVCSQHKK